MTKYHHVIVDLSKWERFLFMHFGIVPKWCGKKLPSVEYKHLDEYYNHKTGNWYTTYRGLGIVFKKEYVHG